MQEREIVRTLRLYQNEDEVISGRPEIDIKFQTSKIVTKHFSIQILKFEITSCPLFEFEVGIVFAVELSSPMLKLYAFPFEFQTLNGSTPFLYRQWESVVCLKSKLLES
jgi:hypothetical protein